MITTTVGVWHTFEAWHRWPKAPDRRAYLRSMHRHLFHANVEVRVTKDRQVEFHDLRDTLIQACKTIPMRSTWSCEKMADCIRKFLSGYDVHRVVVSEDGECAAIVEVTSCTTPQ